MTVRSMQEIIALAEESCALVEVLSEQVEELRRRVMQLETAKGYLAKRPPLRVPPFPPEMIGIGLFPPPEH